MRDHRAEPLGARFLAHRDGKPRSFLSYFLADVWLFEFKIQFQLLCIWEEFSQYVEEIDLAGKFEEQRAKAELKFKRAESAAMRGQAMAEYEADAKATRSKSAKLKTLRLAKEAEEQAAAESAPKVVKRVRKAAKKS
jgi:hypothetical protein